MTVSNLSTVGSQAMIPDFYRRWLYFDFEERWETRRCAECEQASAAIPLPERFSRETKCCTYFPFLPNFTLGNLIEQGKKNASLKLRLVHGFSHGRVTPLGVFPPPEYESRRGQWGSEAFGRRLELLCPFFQRTHGLCSIWNERPGVCSSYICRSTYGERGQELKRALEAYLNLFEWTLAHETLWRLGYTQDDIRLMERLRAEVVWRPEKVWGEWFEREEEFFTKAFHAAREVQSVEIDELMGEEGARLKAKIRDFLATPAASYGRVLPP